MTREEIILSHIKRNGLGLEIAAGCSPIAPKKQGFRVHMLDHCDKEALIEKYWTHGIAVENIEEGDFVWNGRPCTELIGHRHVYDWIIASHTRGTRLDEWCFTPTSFRLMMRDLFELGFIQLKELAFYPTTGSEFYIALSRGGELAGATRLEWLQQVDREQSLS